MNGNFFRDLKKMDEVLEAMKQLYVKMQEQKMVLKNKNIRDRDTIEAFNVQTKEAIEGILNNLNREEKFKFLQDRIEELMIDDTDKEIKSKMNFIFGEYYQRLLQVGKKMLEPKEQKEVILERIKKSKAKIYEDKSKEEWNNYGDFTKIQEGLQIIYRNQNVVLKQIAQYVTKKYPVQNKDYKELEDEMLSQYQLHIEDEPEQIDYITFYGETALGKRIKEGDLRYYSLMLAAIAKAKEKGREHIGRIIMIDEDLETFIVSYDEHLENAVKLLIEREKKEKEDLNIGLVNEERNK